MKPGYIYVLVHPSYPDLYKIGITIRKPEQRLAQYNSDYTQLTGRIVKETGQKWEVKEYYPVPDPYHAESVFRRTTKFADIPYRRRVEVETMSWEEVEKALDAARNAGLRPPEPDQPDYIYAYTAQIRRRRGDVYRRPRGAQLLGSVEQELLLTDRGLPFGCSSYHRYPNDHIQSRA